MKKRTAFIGTILSLIPFGQHLIIKSGLVSSTTGLIFSWPEKVNGESSEFYFKLAFDKAKRGDHYGAIYDYTKAIEINPNKSTGYVNRGRAYYSLNDDVSECKDFRKAVFQGSDSTEDWLNSEGGSWFRNM